MEKIAVLFDRLGPYHWARLKAAANVLPVIALELCAASGEYDWEKITQVAPLRRVTLFGPEEGTSRILPNAAVAKRVAAALDELQPAAVAIPGWSSVAALSALRWCLGQQRSAIVMSESTRWDEPRKRWKEYIKRQLIALFDAGLAGGKPHADYLIELGMPRERIFVGYDAVDNEYFAQGATEVRSRKEEFKSKTRLPDNYFLASARFIEKKNLPFLMDAYARYRQLLANSSANMRAEAWHLVVLGDGPLRTALCDRIRSLGLSQWVHLPGFKQYNELPTYYGLAKAFVHASTTEQWGLVVNEAMANGLPVLLSDRCGCAQDLLVQETNGYTFDPFDPEALARAMVDISMTLPEKLVEMGQASRTIVARFSPTAFATGLAAAVEMSEKKPIEKSTWWRRMLLGALLRVR